MVLTICFQLFKKQTILWRIVVEKNEMNDDVPVSEDVLISEMFFGILYIFKR